MPVFPRNPVFSIVPIVTEPPVKFPDVLNLKKIAADRKEKSDRIARQKAAAKAAKLAARKLKWDRFWSMVKIAVGVIVGFPIFIVVAALVIGAFRAGTSPPPASTPAADAMRPSNVYPDPQPVPKVTTRTSYEPARETKPQIRETTTAKPETPGHEGEHLVKAYSYEKNGKTIHVKEHWAKNPK